MQMCPRNGFEPFSHKNCVWEGLLTPNILWTWLKLRHIFPITTAVLGNKSKISLKQSWRGLCFERRMNGLQDLRPIQNLYWEDRCYVWVEPFPFHCLVSYSVKTWELQKESKVGKCFNQGVVFDLRFLAIWPENILFWTYYWLLQVMAPLMTGFFLDTFLTPLAKKPMDVFIQTAGLAICRTYKSRMVPNSNVKS